MTRAALALGLVAGLVARADLARPTPPLVPEGILDARGQLGFFRTKDGNVAAVELSTGEIRWSASEGVWPLHADLHTVAVAALDPRSSGVLRVRLLRLSDGRRVVKSQPIAVGNSSSRAIPFLANDRVMGTYQKRR